MEFYGISPVIRKYVDRVKIWYANRSREKIERTALYRTAQARIKELEERVAVGEEAQARASELDARIDELELERDEEEKIRRKECGRIVRIAVDKFMDKVGAQYRRELNSIEETYAGLETKIKGELGEVNKQLAFARGVLGYKERRIRDLEEGMLPFLLGIMEKTPIFRGVAGLVLNSDLRPVYATQRFCDTFQVGREEVLSLGVPSLLSHLDTNSRRRVLQYARDRLTDPFDIVTDAPGSHRLRCTPHYFLDSDEAVVATFIYFDSPPGFIESIRSHMRRDSRSKEVVKSVLEAYGGFLRGQVSASST